MPSRARLAATLALALLAAGCGHTWSVENRDTPVTVWLTSKELAARCGTVHALVYVGAHKAVDGPVRFPQGVEHVILAPLRMPAGRQRVSVVIDGGRLTGCSEVEVRGQTWIRVGISTGGVRIDRSGLEPTCPRDPWSPIPGI